VGGASPVLPAIPYAQTLAVSPDGATLYGCISTGGTGGLAGGQRRDGKLLLAGYSSHSTPRTSLLGINPQADTTVTLPVHTDYVIDGIGAAW